MFAIARLHGVINSNEKGAYRVCLWSCIIGIILYYYFLLSSSVYLFIHFSL